MAEDADIRRAEFPADLEALQRIFRGYLEFLFERNPEERENVMQKYPPDRIAELADGFAEAHARPGGDLLLAFAGDAVVGCGMMRRLEPKVAEIQRVFVSDVARGSGIGKRITLRLMQQARKDGYRTLRLDTGRTLTEAIGLYRSLGFRECAPYHDETPYLDHLIMYFERAL